MKKISKSFYFAVILIFLGLKHSESQQLTNFNNNDEPIEIFADDGIEWHKNKNKYVALGNAKALSGSLSVESDKIEAFYKENDSSSMNITEVRAKKNVVVQDKKMKIKKVILDPVMIAKGGSKLITISAVKLMKKKLLNKVSLITPNIPEAEILTGIKIKNKNDIILDAN